VHFLHLALSGVFDRYPDLQIILGHWGEMIPFYLDRLDEALPRRATKLDRTIGDYVRQNVYITPSGMFSQAQLRYCVDVLGTHRIMYSVDYPFIANEDAAAFLDAADLPQAAKEDTAHGTAQKLLGTTRPPVWHSPTRRSPSAGRTVRGHDRDVAASLCPGRLRELDSQSVGPRAGNITCDHPLTSRIARADLLDFVSTAAQGMKPTW
jgi:amidohydrolase family protein